MLFMLGITLAILHDNEWCVKKMSDDDWGIWICVMVICLIDTAITGGLMWIVLK